MAEELQQAQGTSTQTTETAPEGLDVNAAVADIAESLALTPAPEEKEEAAPPEDAGKKEDAALAEEAKKEEPPAVAEPAPTPEDRAPDTWRKEAKEAWATVPPVVKEELRKREQDIARYVESVKTPVSVGEQFTKIVTPYLQEFERAGVNVWDNVAAMFKAQELLLHGSPETKLQMLHSLAQTAGIKIGEGGQLAAAPDATQQYIARLEQRLNQLEGGVKNVTSTVQEARLQELEAGVLEFANDTEKHPFFNEVAGEISHFIQTGAAKSLQEAYDLAVMANTITRQKFLDAQTAQAVKQRDEAEAARVAKARKASKANVRSTARGKAEQPLGDIDSTLRETLADINTRH